MYILKKIWYHKKKLWNKLEMKHYRMANENGSQDEKSMNNQYFVACQFVKCLVFGKRIFDCLCKEHQRDKTGCLECT